MENNSNFLFFKKKNRKRINQKKASSKEEAEKLVEKYNEGKKNSYKDFFLSSKDKEERPDLCKKCKRCDLVFSKNIEGCEYLIEKECLEGSCRYF